MADMHWLPKKAMNYPAAERNKTFILDVLKKYINPAQCGKLLEVSSGTGQHAAYFAAHLPHVTFQPSELDDSLFESIEAYAEQVPEHNMEKPLKLDVLEGPWKVAAPFNYLLNVNMFHVAPFRCAVAFFKYGNQVLVPGGLFFTYGPYANNGLIEPQSNVNFDRQLRSQNVEWGLRDIRDLKKVASALRISLKEVHDLPANNKLLVWEKNPR